eukprot:TRINITY_DN68140_c1_g1_i1.p1 TRINITY_DN68140_c1_g1~~TRINITY_DN68140_c1_g1_i1.p1  ORF type:complete len:420 (+),score=31.16 TRINITY_DN68140_c1_g1_i1:23-1261(+)
MWDLLRFTYFAALCCTAVYGALDLRVSPALGSHGLDYARISVIDRNPTETYGNFFSYNKQFQWRWTNVSLHSVLHKVKPGRNTFKIGTEQVEVRIPQPKEGVRAVFFGDPCMVHTQYLWPCIDNIKGKLPSLLNIMGDKEMLDMWSILGDNFYDLDGFMSETFFELLNQKIKQIPLFTVVGNHDYWVMGAPTRMTAMDQFGNGFMQFYGQDIMYGKNRTVDYLDFSVEPGFPHFRLPPAHNFFQYKMIGNVGFIGYSSAYDWSEQSAFFHEACAYFDKTKPSFLWLVAHWSNCNAGCKEGMNTPVLYDRIKTIQGCNIPGFKNMYGHTHCNTKESDHQFLIGATGFLGDCYSAGVVYMHTFTTPTPRMQLSVFPFASETEYKSLTSCLQQSTTGLDGCMHLSKLWLNQTLAF